MRRPIQNALEDMIHNKLEEGISERGYGFVLTESLLNDKDIVYVLAKTDMPVKGDKAKEFLNYKIRRVVKNAPRDSPVAKMQNQWESIPVDTKGYHIYPGRESIDPETGELLPIDKRTGKSKVRRPAMHQEVVRDSQGKPIKDPNTGENLKRWIATVDKQRVWLIPGDKAILKNLRTRLNIMLGHLNALKEKAAVNGKVVEIEAIQEQVDDLQLQNLEITEKLGQELSEEQKTELQRLRERKKKPVEQEIVQQT